MMQTNPSEESTALATKREWIGLAVLSLPCLLVSMDLTVLNLAIPRLSADLKPTSSQMLWIIDIYGFFIAGSLITMGTLGDRVGRRRLLLIGAAVFGITSVIAAFSNTAETLIVARALLGVAGATLAPSTLSLIRNMFHNPAQRTAAIGTWGISFSIGGVMGPVIGGILLEHYWWGAAFLLSAPVMVLLLVLGPVLLPESKDPAAGKLDLLSAAESLVAVLALIFGLKSFAVDGITGTAITSTAIGIGIGWLFFRRQLRLADPLIDLSLLKSVEFSVSLASNTFACFAMFGLYIFSAQYYQLEAGLTPLQAGFYSLPSALGFIVGSLLTPVFALRIRHSYLMAGGWALMAIGSFLTTLIQGPQGLPLLVAIGVISNLGMAPAFTLAMGFVVGSAPAERAGAAAAMSETGSELGGALGIAILGSIGAYIYRGAIGGAIPAELSPELAEAARSTLGGALGAAQGLTSATADSLLNAAHHAFMRAMQVTAFLCGLVSVCLMVAILLLLRKQTPQVHA